MLVDIEFDLAKDDANRARHGISLARAGDFDLDGASLNEDRRADYGETRFVAVGLLDDRLHVLVFTMRPPVLRAISLRKANARERKCHDHG